MKVTAESIKELRERTGVSMSKCKEALDQSQGDMEKAIDFLRKSGMASAVKKEGREANEGLIGFSDLGEAVAILEINSETDFVAQNDKFKEFLKDLCDEASLSGVSSVEQLLSRPYAKDPSITIDQYRALTMQSLGENIQVKRMLLLPKTKDLSIGVYSHMKGKIVSAVVLAGGSGCESFAKEIAMHIAAEAPEFLKPENVPADVKAREEEVARGQIQGKPENMIAKIVEGKVKSFYDQVCLLCQKFIKDNALTISDVVEQEGKKIGKPLSIQSFVRWKIGG
ncbi:MAG: elongation factor Ts [Verrucomicrobia bacterium]|nr:elongation factor Ts [Verrucomicrobiota bacterium]